MPDPFGGSQAPTVTYLAEELRSGSGYVTYYLGKISDTYVLSDILFYSDEGYTKVTGNPGAGADYFDIDFDVQMNRATTINGNVLLTVPVYQDTGWTVNLKAWLRKWDGSTETDLDYVEGKSFTLGASPLNHMMLGVVFNVSNETIKKGESLRVTLVLHCVGGSYWVNLFHDPLDRDEKGYLPTITSTATLIVPIKVDI